MAFPARTRVLAVLLIACSPVQSLPEQPQLEIDGLFRLDAGDEGIYFGPAFIGTESTFTVTLRNGGLNDLTVSTQYTGDDVFRLTGLSTSGPDGGVVDRLTAGQRGFLRVFFAPRADREYAGTVRIQSNAGNTPDVSLNVRGKGSRPDAGP